MNTSKIIRNATVITLTSFALTGCLSLSKGTPETVVPTKKEPGKGYQTFGTQPYPTDLDDDHVGEGGGDGH